MNDADAPAKVPSPADAESRIDSSGSPIGDSKLTLDSPSPTDFPAVGGATNLGSIGPYQLVKKLGEGGMGQVWLAQQTAPLQRQVALKLIRSGMYDEILLHRFLAERQSLAIMDHPSIAKVFDAGATPDGQPYFVMEYVPGERITTYCDKRRLGIRERLELFIKVCEGVQHAHQKAIIHRDLKPANILIVEVDGKPAPRIIDFGLAKAAVPREAEESILTEAAGFVGTRGFMSPEQADPRTPDLDTRTDVYSLGVVLYVLLTGMLPFDVEEWKKKPFEEVLRQLREDDPQSPSTKVASEKGSALAAAQSRGMGPKRLASLLRGDLDSITMKALEKDRGRRYGTPFELSADISRYLHNEPVVARPAGAAYRTRKYIRRHRLAVGVAATIMVLLAGFAVAQAVELRRITRERDRANRIADFMFRMFEVSDPSEARGNTITAREILDTASQQIDQGLANDPVLQATMMSTMGAVYRNLGLNPRAEELFRRALDIRRRVLGPDNPETLAAMDAVGATLYDEGRIRESADMFQQALAIERRVLGPEHLDTVMLMNNLGGVLTDEGQLSEAETLTREAVRIRQRVLGAENSDTLMSMHNLARILDKEGKFDEAERMNRETLAIRQRVLGPDHPYTLRSMVALALVLREEGHYSDAEQMDRQTLEIERRVLGPEHPMTLVAMTNLADVLTSEKRYADAEKLQRQTFEIERRVLGPDHPLTAISVYNLACLAAKQGRRDEAFLLLRKAIDHLAAVDLQEIANDDDLKSIHGDPRFDALVAYARQRAAEQKPK